MNSDGPKAEDLRSLFHMALRCNLSPGGVLAEHVCQKLILRGKLGSIFETFWMGEPTKEDVFNFRFGDGFATVSVGLIRGPEVNLVSGRSEVDDEMSSFFSSDGVCPPHLHEVTGLRMGV